MTTQNPASAALHASILKAEFSDFEEAARYALLQRLAPALQHHLMGKFQSMGMTIAMMERRLQSAAPDLAVLHEDVASLSSVSRTTVNSIMNIMTWIEPKTASPVRFDAGVRECLGLLSTELRFKGFVILNEVPQIDVELSSKALRSVLCATLLALSDLSKAPAQLVIRAHALPDHVELSIDLRPTEGDTLHAHMTDYRPLKWRDAEILAVAESVKLTRDKSGVQLTFSGGDAAASTGLPGDPVSRAKL